MKLKDLDTAIAEAKRFLARAGAARDAHKRSADTRLFGYDSLSASNPRENGALRRSSMDLSRALSALRK